MEQKQKLSVDRAELERALAFLYDMETGMTKWS